MKKYVSFEEICNHKDNFKTSSLRLVPGVIYKSGISGNHSAEVLSKLMGVGNTGGMRSKNTVNKNTAYVVINITHGNNNWEDSVDYKNYEVIYYGDNAKGINLFDTKHKGNLKLKFLFENIHSPEKQFPLFLFERDDDCVNRDFKYIGLVIPSRAFDGLTVVKDSVNGVIIENYKAKLVLTRDEVDFRWINDLIEGIKPLESSFCPVQWKSAILNDDFGYINELIITGKENWKQESVIESKLEGKKKKIYTTKYERNPELRKKAIKLHGTVCVVCGFDFEKVYGEIGREFIEVHHKKPLYELDEEVKVNPKEDLICVCSNCHRMLHRRRDEVLDVAELKKLVNRNK